MVWKQCPFKVWETGQSLLGLSPENRVDGAQRTSDVLPDNCRRGATHELMHCRGATSKYGFLTIQASSCAQHSSNALKLPGTTVYHLTTWYKSMMDNAFPIKKHNQQHLDLWLTHTCFLGQGDPFIQSTPQAWLSK